MLFILNRIDVFRRDENWQEQTNNFVTKIRHKIRTAVAESLPGYQDQANKLNTQPLSTSPALYAYQALASTSVGICEQALEKIDKNYPSLMPDLIEDLPRKISKWKEADKRQVAEKVWHSSFGYEFDQVLQQHIQDNIPQLLLPHLVKTVTDISAGVLTKVHQITHAHLNATHVRYQAECERLQRISSDLHSLRNTSKQNLLAILDFAENDDVIERLTDIANQLQQTYQLSKDSLVPLHDWSIQLGNTIESFLTSMYKAIMDGSSKPQGLLIESLPPNERQALKDMLQHLQQSGYSNYAEDGGYFETHESKQKEQLTHINRALNELAVILANGLKYLLERTAEREAGRIQDALQVLIARYADLIGEQASAIANDLAGLAVTPSQLSRVSQQLILNFPLTAGFPVRKYQTLEKVGTQQVLDGTERVKTGTRRVKVGEKRLWYTLWLKKKDIYEERDVYETQEKYRTDDVLKQRDYAQAVIPSIKDIFEGFISQAKQARSEDVFVQWLRNQIDEFLRGIEKYQENLLSEYQSRLDQAMHQASQQKEMDIGKWQPIADQVQALQNTIQKLLG